MPPPPVVHDLAAPNAPERPVPVAAHWHFLLVLTATAAVMLWFSLAHRSPWNDSPMFELMLRQYLSTGVVDYLDVCMPTFIGVLPPAVLWAKLFGVSTVSLQVFTSLYLLFGLTGLYLLLLRFVRPGLAAALAGLVLCNGELFLNTPTFMSDTPYFAHLAWFFWAEAALAAPERRGERHRKQRVAWLWAVWASSLAAAVLLRSFALFFVLCLWVNAFLVRLSLRSGGPDAAERGTLRRATAAAVAGTVVALGAMLLFKVVAVNYPDTGNATLLPQLLRGEWQRWMITYALNHLLQAAIMALPCLLMAAGARRIGNLLPSTKGEWALAGAALLFALFSWRLGRLSGTAHGPAAPSLIGPFNLLLVLASPAAVLLLCRTVRDALGALRPTSDGALAPLGVGVLVMHVAVGSVVSYVYLRHFIPVALVAALFSAAALRVREEGSTAVATEGVVPKNLGTAAAAAAAVLLCFNLWQTQHARSVQDALFTVAARAASSGGVTARDVDAGWPWQLARCFGVTGPALSACVAPPSGPPQIRVIVSRESAWPPVAPFRLPWQPPEHVVVGDEVARAVVPDWRARDVIRAVREKGPTTQPGRPVAIVRPQQP